MKERGEHIWLRIFKQAAFITLLSVLFSGFVNQIRPDRLPFVGDWGSEAKQDLAQECYELFTLEKARGYFYSKTCIFLDARCPMLYKKGHIEGAINLPWEEVDIYFDKVMKSIPKDVLLIVYCDGRDCTLSKDLALDLYFSGYDKVAVLENGWSLWKEQYLPFEKDS